MPENLRKPKDHNTEIRPDAWDRFLMAVGYAVKTPAIHREAKKVRPAIKSHPSKAQKAT
jgi:hypothetical protein